MATAGVPVLRFMEPWSVAACALLLLVCARDTVVPSTVSVSSTTSARSEAVSLDRGPLFLPLHIRADITSIGADRWQDAGFTGYGRSVAVIDSGFSGYLGELGDGLPADVTVRSFRGDRDIEGGTDHGLRAAELVHGVAPNAAIYLVNFGTTSELSVLVDYLIAEDVDVISFSLGFIHNGPGDGTGEVNAIVERAVAAGIAWSVASGNWAEQHWGGLFWDENGDSVHDFAPGKPLNGYTFLAGDLVTASLRWADVWGKACTDYDLELFGPDGSLVGAARDIQDCDGDPVESVQVLATKSGRYSVRVIDASSEVPLQLSILLLGSPDRGDSLDLVTAAGSLTQPADSPRVLTVGALGLSSTTAVFSSRGPTADGRTKPDVLATSGVIDGIGPSFSGTSAAAPHAAGMLALLGEAFPNEGGISLISQLTARANAATFGGTPLASLASLAGLGELLPVGADEAKLAGIVPPSGGIAAFQYQGPDGYPLRFSHLLTGLVQAVAFFRLDDGEQKWESHIIGAPDFVQDFEKLNNLDIVVARFPLAISGE